jgi:hypothetical protein
VQAYAGSDGGFAGGEWAVGDAGAGFGEELGVVVGEAGGADGGGGVDDAVGEGVDAGAALRLVEAVGGFEADAGADLYLARWAGGRW